MLGINHTTTGIIIALTVRDPLVALPLALGSHFVLDMIPHHGNDIRFIRGKKRYNEKIALDGLTCILITIGAIMLVPQMAGIIVACAFLSLFPDMLWPIALHIKETNPFWKFFKLHKGIQRETPQGIGIEILWAAMTGYVLVSLIR